MEEAKNNGKQAFEWAEKINDEVWQLNSTVLIAQAEFKIGDEVNLTSAMSNFEIALKMTEKQRMA